MRAFGITHRGVVRADNQDSFRLLLREEEDLALLVLCDGMGGAAAGALASSTAVEAFMAHAGRCLRESPPLDAGTIVKEAAVFANIRVYDLARSDESYAGMGTTLVACFVHGGEAALVNVGDSRAYLFRGGALEQLSRDHSLVEELVRRGDITRAQARTHPQKNVITRAVGLEYRVKCDVFTPQLLVGDRLLLCSDGLSNVLSEERIAQILLGFDDLEDACRELLRCALENGAPDNVTVLLLCR